MAQKTSPMPVSNYSDLQSTAEAKRREIEAHPGPKIDIGLATCGVAAGALETKTAVEEALAERGLEARIRTVGCNGHCYAEPFVVIDHPASGFPPIAYPEVTPGKARMLTKLFLEEGDPRFEHILGATVENEMVPWVMEFPRFHLESRILLEKCGRIDPEDIYDYIAEGGYGALANAIERNPDEIIASLIDARLRGRGGAGFQTGLKWQIAAAAEHHRKYVVCNADEGDPGAYMDRTILESNPHQVLEGLLLCAYAVGADKALVYVRAEYPLHWVWWGREFWAAGLIVRLNFLRDPALLFVEKRRP